MVYNDMYKPSANMNLHPTVLNSMIREQLQDMYQAEQDKEDMENAAYVRGMEENAAYTRDYINSRESAINNRAAFLESVKNNLLTAAILKPYKEAMNSVVTDSDKRVMQNLVKKFVEEQGAGDLLTRFKYQNTLTAELGRVVQESYDRIIESIDSDKKRDELNSFIPKVDEKDIPNAAAPLKIPQTDVDEFYKDLAEVDTAEASKLIKDKVSDAMGEFVDQNLMNKTDFQEVINTAKEKLTDVKDEATIEYTMNEAKRQINEMRRTRHKNVFHYLVEAITKETFKDDSLRTRYLHESTVDMSGIIHSAELIYTMLETFNTTEMVSEDYIKNYIISLTQA